MVQENINVRIEEKKLRKQNEWNDELDRKEEKRVKDVAKLHKAAMLRMNKKRRRRGGKKK